MFGYNPKSAQIICNRSGDYRRKNNRVAYCQVKDIHIGNSSHVLVACDNDHKDDIRDCAKY